MATKGPLTEEHKRKIGEANKGNPSMKVLRLGFNSRLAGGRHMILIDIDRRLKKAEIVSKVRQLQKGYFLHEAVLYRTRHGYHVVFYYDAFPFKEYYHLLVGFLPVVDVKFVKLTRYNRYGTLRLGGRDKHEFEVIKEPNGSPISSKRRLIGDAYRKMDLAFLR